MPGAQTRLDLMAGEPGICEGHNQQFDGRGYSDIAEKFEAWVRQSRQSPDTLDLVSYEELKNPGADRPVTHFSRSSPRDACFRLSSVYTGLTVLQLKPDLF
jgi:hypothetical protein